MVLFELMSQRYPFENCGFPNQAVIDGKRPDLLGHEARALIRLQDLMKICWDQEPENRPRMEQVVEWIKAPEFESLRAEITFEGVATITCACVCRILPEHVTTTTTDSDEHNYSRVGVIYNQDGKLLTNGSLGDIGTFGLIEEFGGTSTFFDQIIQHLSSSNSMEQNRVDQVAEDVEAGMQLEASDSGQKKKGRFDPHTQIWMYGRYKETKLLQISTFIDGIPGYTVSFSHRV